MTAAPTIADRAGDTALPGSDTAPAATTVHVEVRLKAGVFDPPGEATRRALCDLGIDGVQDVRIARLVTMRIAAPTPSEARAAAARAADELLANPVIESWRIVDLSEGGGHT